MARFTTKEEIGKLITEFFEKMHQQRVDAQKAIEAAKAAEQARLKEIEAAKNLEAMKNASVVVTPSPVMAVETSMKATETAALAPSLLISSSPTISSKSSPPEGSSSLLLRDVNAPKAPVERLPLEGTFCSDETRLEGWLSKVKRRRHFIHSFIHTLYFPLLFTSKQSSPVCQ